MWNFEPVLKQTIWGGEKIIPFKGLEIEESQIGESWEISGIPSSESVVASGPDIGETLTGLVRKYGADLLGERVYKRCGERFPLLIKIIDARQDLSVQVHPDDALAHELGMDNGKTEMWYVIDALPGARLASGFTHPVDPADYERLVESGDIEKTLRYVPVKKGDTFFIPAGRVHAIGAGIMVAEIQQASDTTFRLYDYHRKDAQGHERELHTELAKRAIRFDDTEGEAVKYTLREDIPVNLVKCQCFTTNLLMLDEQLMRDYSELDSFVVVMALEGSAELRCTSLLKSASPEPQVSTLRLHAGQTALISARALGLEITPAGRFKALESFC